LLTGLVTDIAEIDMNRAITKVIGGDSVFVARKLWPPITHKLETGTMFVYALGVDAGFED
jgi:hypothetical protein